MPTSGKRPWKKVIRNGWRSRENIAWVLEGTSSGKFSHLTCEDGVPLGGAGAGTGHEDLQD